VETRIDAPMRRGGRIREEILSGAAFVWNHAILLHALTLDMVSVLFGGVTALLPIYADEILHVGATGLGLLRAGPAVGSMLGSILLTRWDIRRQAGPLLLAAVFGFGLCMLAFGVSHSFYFSLFVLAVSGAFDSISVIVRSSAVQLASPEHMRGRISAVNSIFIGSSNEIGEFESGVAARFFGTVPSVVLGSAICLFTVVFLGLRSSELRQLDLTHLEPPSIGSGA
jgi:MFS family permease